MKTFEYALKTWQTSVLISPVCLAICFSFNNFDSELFFFVLVAIITSIIYSLPSFLIFWLASYLVAEINLTQVQQKSLLSIVGIALTFLAFALFSKKGFTPANIGVVSPYALIIVASIWFYKLRSKYDYTVEDINAC